MTTDTFDALLAQGLAAGAFPGAQLSVGDAGRPVIERAIGLRALGGPAVDTDTLFDVASLTKAIATALIVLRFVEQGRLKWDAITPIPGVTVRHLLTHSSGLPAWRPLYEVGRDRAAIVRQAIHTPPERPPGTASVYSDLGFIVLGALLEELGGARLDRLFAREIADPLGVASRFVDLDQPERPRTAAATEGRLGEVDDDNCHAAGGILGHAGLFSTARDLATVAEALLDAWHGVPRRFPPELVQTLFTRCNVPASTWRLGWDGPAPSGSQAGERWPKDGVGHLGFTGCSIWLDCARRRWVVFLTNRVHPTRANTAIKQFRPLLHDTIVQALDAR